MVSTSAPQGMSVHNRPAHVPTQCQAMHGTRSRQSIRSRTVLDMLGSAFVLVERMLSEPNLWAKLAIVKVEGLKDMIQRAHKRQAQLDRPWQAAPVQRGPVPVTIALQLWHHNGSVGGQRNRKQLANLHRSACMSTLAFVKYPLCAICHPPTRSHTARRAPGWGEFVCAAVVHLRGPCCLIAGGAPSCHSTIHLVAEKA